MSQPNALSNLATLPLELREGIYESMSPAIKSIVFDPGFRGSIQTYLRNELPKALSSDPQFADEATMAYIRQATGTVQSVTVPGPQSFDIPLPSGMAWEAVRDLEFTAAQREFADTSGKISIRDVLRRCPNLENLTLSIYANLIVDHDLSHSDKYTKADVPRDLFQVLEHPKLRHLTLNVANAHQAPLYEEYKWLHKVNAFVEEFEREKREKNRHVVLKVELTPGVVKDPRNPEMARLEYNGITYIQYYDFFG